MTDYRDEFVRITEIVSLICGYGRYDGFYENIPDMLSRSETSDGAEKFDDSGDIDPYRADDADSDENSGTFNPYNADIAAADENFDAQDSYDFIQGMTISRLAEKLHCTPRQMRSDIAALLKAGIVMPADGTEIKNLKEKNAAYDDVPLCIGKILPEDYGPALLFLDAPAYQLYRREAGDILAKDSPFVHTPDEREDIKIIEKAIKQKRRVHFRYDSPNETANLDIDILPRLIYHDLTNEQYYCIAVNEENQILAYRIDRIKFGVKVRGKDENAPDLDEAVRKRLKMVWGADFSHDEEPVHVKVRLTAGTRNLVNKFSADVSGRGHLNKVGTENGTDIYIYEDDIIGESAFRAWLRRYGSSVKVLEPQSIADDMRENALRAKMNYEEGHFLSDAAFENILADDNISGQNGSGI